MNCQSAVNARKASTSDLRHTTPRGSGQTKGVRQGRGGGVGEGGEGL